MDLAKMKKAAEIDRDDLDFLRGKLLNRDKDKNGSVSNALSGSLRFIAVADYVISNDIDSFRAKLAESASLRSALFARFDNGEPISPSYVSMLAYKVLFNSIASGDVSLSQSIAGAMGGRDSIEKQYDRYFDLALGYTLKSIIAQNYLEAKEWNEKLAKACCDPENHDFIGYYTVFNGILEHDEHVVLAGFAELISGHKRQSKGSGIFKDTEDEVLCVWGIAMANLARLNQLKVELNETLIPSELLISC